MTTSADPHSFTLAGYRALVDALREQGYVACGFAEAEPTSRHLILRHDVDMELGAAVAMAEVEAEAGLAATYFVLLRTEFYNVFSAAGRDALARLAALGHTVGLHFDAALHPADRTALEAAVATECDALAMALGQPVEVVSFHRPAPALQGLAGTLAGRRHAYEPRFFKDCGYVSDSRGGWHYGHPLDHPAVAEGRALQLLTHPIWWTGREGDTPQDRLDAFLRDRSETLTSELSHHCGVFRRP